MSDYILWLIISICSLFILGYIWFACKGSGSATPPKKKEKKEKKSNRDGVYRSKFVREGAEERIRRRMAR